MANPNEPRLDGDELPEAPWMPATSADELSQAAQSTFRAHAEAVLNNGTLLNKLGEDWFVSIGTLTQTFRESFDSPDNKLRTFDHEQLVMVLGVEFLQKIVARIREMENALEDPWDEYSPTLTLKVLYEDGTPSTRNIDVYDDDSSKERLLETDGMNFQIQSPREWFWRNVPEGDRPADYLTRE